MSGGGAGSCWCWRTASGPSRWPAGWWSSQRRRSPQAAGSFLSLLLRQWMCPGPKPSLNWSWPDVLSRQKKNTFTFTQKQTKFRCLHDNICRTTTQEDSVSVLNVLNQLKRRRLWVEGQTEPQAPDTQWGPMIDPESSPGKTQSCLSMNFLMGGWQLVWL